MVMENYFFDIQEEKKDDRVFVLIIYDIVDNKRRVKLAKYLQGYGFRVQKSALEVSRKRHIVLSTGSELHIRVIGRYFLWDLRDMGIHRINRFRHLREIHIL